MDALASNGQGNLWPWGQGQAPEQGSKIHHLTTGYGVHAVKY